MNWKDYNIDLGNFQFCVKKKCPLRKSCLRKVETPFNSEYYTTGGNYNRETNSCSKYIDKSKWQEK